MDRRDRRRRGDDLTSARLGRGYRRPYVSVDNTDIEMLEELTRLSGGGYVAKRSSAAQGSQCFPTASGE